MLHLTTMQLFVVFLKKVLLVPYVFSYIYIYIYIYINEIYKSALKVFFQIFADDTCLFYANKFIIDVNISLDDNESWLKANKLISNVKKWNLLVFDPRKKSNEKPLLF